MNAVGVALCLVRVVVYEKPSPLYALARNENDLQERRDSLGDCAIGFFWIFRKILLGGLPPGLRQDSEGLGGARGEAHVALVVRGTAGE